MKAPSPAFSFYPKDILSDEAAASMTDEELGVYVRLLCHAWLEGSIPADMDRLAKMTRRRRPVFEKLWKAIGLCWRQSDDDPGRLVQGRLEQERVKQRAYSATQSERAKAGVQVRRGSAVAQPGHSQRTSPEAAGASLPSPSPDNASTYLPTARADAAGSPFPEQRADDATKAMIRTLQSKFGGLLAKLSEHPKSRRMVPAWCKVCTAYDKPGVGRMDGVSDYRTVFSIERLERSIRDAEWNLEQLDRQPEVQHGA